MKATHASLTVAATIALTGSAHAAAGLEKMLPNLPRCETGQFFLDPASHEPKSEYLRTITPYKIEKGFAYYRLKATYYGLPVTEIMVPASTWGIFALTFDAPLPTARAQLKAKLASEFRSMAEHDAGKAPLLHEDRANKQRSVLVCTSAQQ
jgi:hypothetical protein